MSESSEESLPLSGLEMRIEDYKKLGKLGQGSYGRVDHVVHKGSGKHYALKIVNTEKMDADDLEALKREVEILGTVDHEAVLSLRGYQFPRRGEHTAGILMDFMSKGSVESMLRKERHEKASEKWTITSKFIVIFGVAAGMKYLHNMNIIHRDLKPGNVLLDSHYEPHIGDFGFSKFTRSQRDATMSMVGGTPIYMAPELYETNKYGFKVDVYAFGMLVFEILTATVPFDDLTNPNAIALKVSKGVRPEIPKNIPRCFHNLIEECWHQNPSMRPSFDKIVGALLGSDFNLPKYLDMSAIRQYQERVLSGQYAPLAIGSLSAENQWLRRRVEKLEKRTAELEGNADTFKKRNDVLKDHIDKMMKTIEALTDKVQYLTDTNKELWDRLDACVGIEEPETRTHSGGGSKIIRYNAERGIIAYLMKMSSITDRKVVISQSSCDLYEIIDPGYHASSSPVMYMTSDETCNNYIQFRFPHEIKISGIELKSATSNFLKSWRFVSMNKGSVEEVIYESDGEKDLNKKNGEAVINFKKCFEGTTFRIEQTGMTWDNAKAFALRKIEFMGKNQDGIFAEMLSDEEDPHVADVEITANDNDFSELFDKASKKMVRTLSNPSPSWIQFEFPKARFTPNGFRLRAPHVRSWQLMGSNDMCIDTDQWTVIEYDEDKSSKSSGTLVAQCYPEKSYAYIRLVYDSPDKCLEIQYFDMFGQYASFI